MTTQSCIPNIGPRERRRRLVMGVVVGGLTVALAVWLVSAGAPRVWRLLVFVPAWIAALDFLQVRAKTCVLLAAKGVRNMDAGNEAIGEAAELTAVRAQARAVHVQSLVTAAVATAAVMAAPGP
jgi:hypothetical protein